MINFFEAERKPVLKRAARFPLKCCGYAAYHPLHAA